MLVPTTTIQAIAVAPGIAIGRVMRIGKSGMETQEPRFIAPEETEKELLRLQSAIARTRQELLSLQLQLRDKLHNGEAGIFDAQLLILEDQTLMQEVRSGIEGKRYCAEYSLFSAGQKIAAAFSAIRDAYLQERAADLRDVVSRVIANLSENGAPKIAYNEPRIIIASVLNPSETAGVDRDKVLGFAVETGSATSHTAILARSLKLPAVVGVPRELLDQLTLADKLIIDGFSGKLIVNPDERTIEAYTLKRKIEKQFFSSLQQEKDLPAETTDGFRIQLAANLDAEQDYEDVKNAGAGGVGLFRTEFLFLDREHLPDEEQQFQVYKKLLVAAGDEPVTIRTIDVGGDKFDSKIQRATEQNPFLGLRGIRLCLRERRDLFDAQLRALLRAGVYGNLRIMLPMVCSLTEVRETKAIIAQLQKDLAAHSIPCASRLPLGVMIETPAAAMIAGKLAEISDFFSIGTNDLIQYTMAVDRSNERVAHLYRPTHPAILRLIAETLKAAREHNIFVSVCGQMAENVMMTPLLLGMGVDELSMPTASIPLLRRTIRHLERYACEELVEQALACGTAAEVLVLTREMMERCVPEMLSR